MMRKYATLQATVERWTDRKGEQRARRLSVGSIFRDDGSGRMSIRLDALPVSSDWSGWLSIVLVHDDDTSDGGDDAGQA